MTFRCLISNVSPCWNIRPIALLLLFPFASRSAGFKPGGPRPPVVALAGEVVVQSDAVANSFARLCGGSVVMRKVHLVVPSFKLSGR